MRALVTGAAGFIGSSIVDRLLDEGHDVIGVDCFTPYYDRKVKERNLINAREFSNFKFLELDLSKDSLQSTLDGVTDIFHQAGQPGVRASWGKDFLNYVEWNVWATQQLLEAARNCTTLKSFVAASSSSVYGSAERYPTSEQDLPKPISPYGVTKLASEHLSSLYGSEFGLPTVSLRYFTVYGPRQRPDMAISRIIDSALSGQEFRINGNGQQSRDFSFIGDVVDANVAVAERINNGHRLSPVYNVGGNSPVSINQVVRHIEEITGSSLNQANTQREDGDPLFTGADISLISHEIGWQPRTSLLDGLRAQVESFSSLTR